MANHLTPEELTSEYRSNLRQMLEAKLAGEEIARPAPTEAETPVVDLMEALRASVASAKQKKSAPAGKGKGSSSSSKAGTRKRTPARKSA